MPFMVGPRTFMRNNIIDQGQQRRPVFCNIDNDNRLVMQPELPPGINLEKFIHRAESTGQDDEGIRKIDHHQPPVRDFFVGDMGWNNAGDLPPLRHNRIGDNAHQPDMAATVDKAQPRSGQNGAQRFSSLLEHGINPPRRPAIDANAFHSIPPSSALVFKT